MRRLGSQLLGVGFLDLAVQYSLDIVPDDVAHYRKSILSSNVFWRMLVAISCKAGLLIFSEISLF